MKSYGQACGLAKALDAVGDRWTLLIVRELLIRDTCRYTDLRLGLPGIATNLLAERLRGLENDGLVARAFAPPPIATDLYSLTPRGKLLEPALMLLGHWGAALLGDGDSGEVFQAHWMVLPLRSLLQPRGDARVAIHSDGEAIAIVAAGGRVDVRVAPLPDAAAVVEGPGRAVFAHLTGGLTASAARKAGVTVRGDRQALATLVPSAFRST